MRISRMQHFLSALLAGACFACLPPALPDHSGDNLSGLYYLRTLIAGQPVVGRTWSRLGTAPMQARFGHALTVFKGELYLLGGKTDAGLVQGDVWASGDGRNWRLVASNSFLGRYHHAALGTTSALIVMGGRGSSDSLLADVHVFDGNTWVNSGHTTPIGGDLHLFASQGALFAPAQGSVKAYSVAAGFGTTAGTYAFVTDESRTGCVMVSSEGANILSADSRLSLLSNAGGIFTLRQVVTVPFAGPCMAYDGKFYLLGGPGHSPDGVNWSLLPTTQYPTDGNPVLGNVTADSFVVFQDRIYAVVAENGAMNVYASLGSGGGTTGAPLTDGSL